MSRRAKYILCMILAVMLLIFQARSVLSLCCINDHHNHDKSFVFHHHYAVSPNTPLCENVVERAATCVKKAPQKCDQESSDIVAATGLQKWSQDVHAVPVSSPAPVMRPGLNAEDMTRLPGNIPTPTVYLLNLAFLC